jgi:hypothetical protein
MLVFEAYYSVYLIDDHIAALLLHGISELHAVIY